MARQRGWARAKLGDTESNRKIEDTSGISKKDDGKRRRFKKQFRPAAHSLFARWRTENIEDDKAEAARRKTFEAGYLPASDTTLSFRNGRTLS